MGREVKSFGLNPQTAGTYEIEWNGTNNNGSLVSSGIYLLHLMQHHLIAIIKQQN